MTPDPHSIIRALLAILTRTGGYMTPEDQETIRLASEAVNNAPPAKPWEDRR